VTDAQTGAPGSDPAWVVRLRVPEGDGATVAVKDAIDVAGLPTRGGTRALDDALPAESDSPAVAAVRAAGGRIVGKTGLAELCWFASGINRAMGSPVNPLAAERIPGGSSSGSAVVVARGEVDVALGTDTGGSVRIPAACCGVCGLKTTRGRVPLEGVLPLAPSMDTVGPIALDVDGLVTGMRLLDPSFAAQWSAASGRDAAELRVVRLRPDTGPDVEGWIDAEVDTALAASGVDVVDAAVTGWDTAAQAADLLLSAEAGDAQEHWLGRPVSEGVRRCIEAGRVARDDHEGRQAAERAIDEMRQQLADLLSGRDALVLPTLAITPPLLVEHSGSRTTRLTITVNALGWPAAAVPAAQPVPGRIPASVQVVGAPGDEATVLAVAALLPRTRAN
jgi:amidase